MKRGIWMVLCLWMLLFFSGMAQTTVPEPSESSLQESIDFVHPDLERMHAALFEITNQYRKKYKVAPLEFNAELQEAAQLHSGQMVKHHFFDHVNRYERTYSDLGKRMKAVGYSWSQVFENIHVAYYDADLIPTYRQWAEKAVGDFYRSKEHRQNMLNRQATELGVAAAIEKVKGGGYAIKVTQVLGRR